METQLEQLHRRRKSLHKERANHIDHWRDLNKFILPRSGEFLDDTPGQSKRAAYNNIYDSTATTDLRILSAGLMAGMTSPARPWFRLALSDKELMEHAPIKLWLNDVTNLMRDVFSRSNTYRALHSLYGELGVYGTASSIVLPHFGSVLHHNPLTIGEYAIAVDEYGYANTLSRDYNATVSQLVSSFGLDNVSTYVKNAYDKSNYDTLVPVSHVIQPREMVDRSKGSKGYPVASVYFETKGQENKVLRETGFKRFPALCPRWEVYGSDVYGGSPAMLALGDVKQLQHQQLRKGKAIDFMVEGPLQAPGSLKEGALNNFPGGITYFDGVGAKATPLYDVRLDLSHLLADVQDVRERIHRVFYADLFMMLANDTRSNITAREIAERHEEKLLMLGPVLERLHNELLSALIDLAFDRIMDAGLMPPPPKELEGQDLQVEFVSVLAQAQRAIGTQSVDRLLGTIAGVAQIRPEVVDKLNADQVIDSYADLLGVDPNLIVADENVAIIRQNRAQQEQAMQAAAAAQPVADAAAKLGNIQTGEGRTMAADFMQQISGYGG